MRYEMVVSVKRILLFQNHWILRILFPFQKSIDNYFIYIITIDLNWPYLSFYATLDENWIKHNFFQSKCSWNFFIRCSKTYLLPWTLFVCWLEWIDCMRSLYIACPVHTWKNRCIELSFRTDQNERMWVVSWELLIKTIAFCETEYPKRRSYGIRITPIKQTEKKYWNHISYFIAHINNNK